MLTTCPLNYLNFKLKKTKKTRWVQVNTQIYPLNKLPMVISDVKH